MLKGELKQFVKQWFFEIQKDYPEVEIEKFSIQDDHVRLVSVIPLKYWVS